MAVYLYLKKKKSFLHIVSLKFLSRNDPPCTLNSVMHRVLLSCFTNEWLLPSTVGKKYDEQQEHIQQTFIAQIRCRKQRLHQPQGNNVPY